MEGHVLVIGADARLPAALERLIPGVTVKSACTAAMTEGLNTDVVVIAGEHPVEQLTEVRVHPNLHETPVVLFVPGRHMLEDDWAPSRVWPVTSQGFDALDEVIERVALLLSRAQGPTATGRRASVSAA